jgi:hypothetical protein
MSDYPTLLEMGINNPKEIDRYSLQTVNNVDILRIVYRRQKGSLLPVSKRFRFGRAEKLILAEGDHRAAQIQHEISPFVRKALLELDKIVAGKRDRRNQLDIIKEEMQRLQEETSSRLAYVQSLIDEL